MVKDNKGAEVRRRGARTRQLGAKSVACADRGCAVWEGEEGRVEGSLEGALKSKPKGFEVRSRRVWRALRVGRAR